MSEGADLARNKYLPSLPCQARLVLALQSALLGHHSDSQRLQTAVCECVADLKAQRLTSEQVIATISELVRQVSCGEWMRIPPSEATALASQVAHWSAAEYDRSG